MRVGSLWRCAAGRVETFGYVPCSLTSNASSNASSDFVRHIRPRKSRGRNGSVIARRGVTLAKLIGKPVFPSTSPGNSNDWR